MAAQLTIQLLGWNSEQALAKTAPMLRAIPSDHAIIRYIDNNSRDQSVATVQKLLPAADIVSLPENAGYAGGHNVGFARCTTPFVLVVNPDVELNWLGIQQLLHCITNDSAIAAVQGLLLRPGEDHRIDSAGIILTATLNGVDRGAGKVRTADFDRAVVVTATTGACSLFRLSALQQVSHRRYVVGGHDALEVFDHQFFAYKEDVDLGWRLGSRGWRTRYEPVIAGYHGRSLSSQGAFGWKLAPGAVITRLRDPRTRLSLRNYVWLLTKNASPKQLLIHGLLIDARLLFFLGLSLVYWPLLKVWPEIIRGLPSVLEKRAAIRYASGANRIANI